MKPQEIIGIYEAYQQVYAQPEAKKVEAWVNALIEEGYDLSEYTWDDMYGFYLDEARTDPRGRPASGPMNVYGGRGQDAGPGGSGNANVDRMDAAQRRVKATQPAKKGRAADALFTRYSGRQTGRGSGENPTPSDTTAQGHPHSPRRGGRPGRGANTDRGGGHAAERRMRREDFDLFDTIIEHLVAEGYADTNEAAVAIMANMSEEWKQSIVEADSLADMAARREKRLKAQRKREGRPSGGGDFGHDYNKPPAQAAAEREERMKKFTNKKG